MGWQNSTETMTLKCGENVLFLIFVSNLDSLLSHILTHRFQEECPVFSLVYT